MILSIFLLFLTCFDSLNIIYLTIIDYLFLLPLWLIMYEYCLNMLHKIQNTGLFSKFHCISIISLYKLNFVLKLKSARNIRLIFRYAILYYSTINLSNNYDGINSIFYPFKHPNHLFRWKHLRFQIVWDVIFFMH